MEERLQTFWKGNFVHNLGIKKEQKMKAKQQN